MPDEIRTTESKLVVAVQLTIEPCLVDVETVSRMLSISSRHFAALEKSGAIGPEQISIGNSSRKLFSVDEIRAWIKSGCPRREHWIKK